MANDNIDRSLLKSYYTKGDVKSMERFIERHRNWALRQAASISSEDAEDVVQISTLRLLDAKPLNGVVNNPLGWWRSVIANTAFEQIRAKVSRQVREQEFVERILAHSDDINVETVSNQKQLVSWITDAIHKLDESFKSVLQLRFFDGLSYTEIAQTLDISIGTVSSRINRGLKRLREVLRQLEAEFGVLFRTPTTTQGATVATNEILESNRRFAERWNNLWTVCGRCIGKMSSVVHPNGDVTIKWRQDIPSKDSSYDAEYPEQAANRRWEEEEITIADSRRFSWTEIRHEEGACGTALESMKKRRTLIGDKHTLRPADNKLEVEGAHSGSAMVAAEGEGPIVTNSLLPLLLSAPEVHEKLSWPLRLFGYYLPEEKHREIEYVVMPCKVEYVGQIGKPLKQGKLFDIIYQDRSLMEISVLDDDRNDLICVSWPEESLFFSSDEAAARAMMLSR